MTSAASALPGHFSCPVDFEPRLLNHIQRNAQLVAFAQFQQDLPIMESLEPPSKNLLLIQWDTSLDSGQLSLEASVVTFLDQFPIQTRRGNFQRVRKRNQIFNIEYRSYLFTDQLAIAVRNARRLVDVHPQDRALARSLEFHIN